MRWYFLQTKYGLSKEAYEALFSAQEGRCAICRCLAADDRRPIKNGHQTNGLCVDHDHRTGAVRGLLCDTCNRGIGFFKESPELLEQAQRYLASPT